jgi:hypothetical protein
MMRYISMVASASVAVCLEIVSVIPFLRLHVTAETDIRLPVNSLEDFWMFNLSTNVWIKLGNGPYQLANSGGTFTDNGIAYLFGGSNGNHPEKFLHYQKIISIACLINVRDRLCQWHFSTIQHHRQQLDRSHINNIQTRVGREDRTRA